MPIISDKLFPEKGRGVLFKQHGELGDCYLLATLDYLFGCEEGRDFIEKLFTIKENGVEVRLKHSALSEKLKPHHSILREKYSYTHDEVAGQDVFFVPNDYLEKIDIHPTGVETETLAIKILEHIIPYYYKGTEAHHVRYALDSVAVHGKDLRRVDSTHNQTQFLAQIFGIETDETLTIDDVTKIKQIAPNFPFYLSMIYTEGRHAFVVDSLRGTLLRLRNPHNNSKLQSYAIDAIRGKKPRFVHYKINPGELMVLKVLITLPLEEAKKIKENKELFTFLSLISGRHGRLEQSMLHLICTLYEQHQSRIVSYFHDLSRDHQDLMITAFATTNDIRSWATWIRNTGISYRQLQRIELVHQLIEAGLLTVPDSLNPATLKSANQETLIEAFKMLTLQGSSDEIEGIISRYRADLADSDVLIQQIRTKMTTTEPQAARVMFNDSPPSTPKDKFSYYLEDNNDVKDLDYFQIMKIPEDFDFTGLNKQYRALMLEFHPDKNGNSDRAKICTQLVTDAYTVFKDPEARARYRANRAKAYVFREDFNYADLTQYFNEKMNSIDELRLRFEHLHTAQHASEDTLEKIILDLGDAWSNLVSEDLAAKQYQLYDKIKEQAHTGHEYYGLYLISSRESLMRMRQSMGIDSSDLAAAASQYHPLAMEKVAGKALAGHYSDLEHSIRWGLKAIHYLETVCIPELERSDTEKDLLANLKDELNKIRARRAEVLHEPIPTDPERFDIFSNKVLAYRQARGGVSKELFTLLNEDMFLRLFPQNTPVSLPERHEHPEPPPTPARIKKVKKVRFNIPEAGKEEVKEVRDSEPFSPPSEDQTLIFNVNQINALNKLIEALKQKHDNEKDKSLNDWLGELFTIANTFKADCNLGNFKRDMSTTLNKGFLAFAKPHTFGEKAYDAVVSLLNAFIHLFDFNKSRPDFFSRFPSKRSLELKKEFDTALHDFECTMSSGRDGNLSIS